MRQGADAIHDSRTMALVGAVMFTSGGILTLVSMRMPHPSGLASDTPLVTSTLAITAGVLLALVGRRMPVWAFQVLLQFGNVLIAVSIYAGGAFEATRIFTLLYLWGALYASYFFSRRLMLVYMGSGAVSWATAAALRNDSLEWVAEWFVMVGSFLIAGILVNWMTRRMNALARMDPLTSLANRRTLEQELVRDLARADRDGRPMSVLLVDIDNLKSVNDAHGHDAGDAILRDAGSAWSSRLRSGDLLARYGGDEFAALLPDCSLHDATLVAERLRSSASDGPSCSVGIALWDGRESGNELLTRADRALYEAKRRGRNRVMAAPLAPLLAGPAVPHPAPGM